VIDMAHHCHYRRPWPQIFLAILLVDEGFSVIARSCLDTIAEALSQRCRFLKVDHRIDRSHDAQLHQHPNDLCRACIHLLRELFHRHSLGQTQVLFRWSFDDRRCLNGGGRLRGFDYDRRLLLNHHWRWGHRRWYRRLRGHNHRGCAEGIFIKAFLFFLNHWWCHQRILDRGWRRCLQQVSHKLGGLFIDTTHVTLQIDPLSFQFVHEVFTRAP
jgi:hypothetical protein